MEIIGGIPCGITVAVDGGDTSVALCLGDGVGELPVPQPVKGERQQLAEPRYKQTWPTRWNATSV